MDLVARWHQAVAQFKAKAGVLMPATLGPPCSHSYYIFPFRLCAGQRMEVCGNGSCWFYSIMAAYGILEHAKKGSLVPTKQDYDISQWWLQQLQVCSGNFGSLGCI